ncbi:F0F1 ATP synthase subunit B family protein [Roseomonas populi]|uniref:ATP synthase subunit b n=1 Tax=Roseomonas populi TaxID=3121582 RepID=A0ABT1X693_9PROT|nr:ATPase [Roseomonas pecuniae]MCR0983622.1 ATPase [Roseomonas pecuniae]
MIRLPFAQLWHAAALALLLSQAPAALAQHVTAPAPTGSVQTNAPLPGQQGESVAVQADSDRATAVREANRTAAEYEHAAREAADAGGMPQLDFANPLTIAQVIWLFVIFGLLVFLAAHYLLPPVAEVLETRRARIASDLDAARDARAQAEAAEAGQRDSTARARAEAQASIAAATQAAQADAAKRAEALAERLNAQITEAETRIGAARDAAMGALREAATDAAAALVQRLAGIEDKAAVDAAVSRELSARNMGAA